MKEKIAEFCISSLHLNYTVLFEFEIHFIFYLCTLVSYCIIFFIRLVEVSKTCNRCCSRAMIRGLGM